MFRDAQKCAAETPRIPAGRSLFPAVTIPNNTQMRKYNHDAPGVKLRGRPKKNISEKRAKKISATFTDDELSIVKTKAAQAGMTVAELLRVSVFRLTIIERLTDFERAAIRELMYQGKNLNDQVKACQANAWPSTKRKAEACLDGILAILGKLKIQNSTLL